MKILRKFNCRKNGLIIFSVRQRIIFKSSETFRIKLRNILASAKLSPENRTLQPSITTLIRFGSQEGNYNFRSSQRFPKARLTYSVAKLKLPQSAPCATHSQKHRALRLLDTFPSAAFD